MKDSLRLNVNNNGFSLIEVTIILMVISILMGGILQTYNVYRAQKQENDTNVSLLLIQSALNRYVEKYGRYPLPADRDNAIGTANFGRSVAGIPGGISCNANPGKACRLTGSGLTYRGDVPFATLGIHYKNVIDSYGRKFTYAITANLTNSGTFTDNGGAIQILSSGGANLYTGTTPLAHFFVFSSGPDGQGAYGLSGTQVAACGPAANGVDRENCDSNNTFRSNFNATSGRQIRLFANGNTNFDDVSIYQNSLSSALWRMNAAGQLTREAGANVLIGVIEGTSASACPTGSTSGCVSPPRVSLDVRGDGTNGVVSATELRTNRLCYDNSTTGCTSPDATSYDSFMLKPVFYGGTPNTSGAFNTTTQGNVGGGILCGGNRALKGFSYQGATGLLDETCTDSALILNNSTLSSATGCSLGQYAVGINAAGAIICGP